MVRVVFRNLAKSNLIKDAIDEKVNHVLSKFPDLGSARATVMIGTATSPSSTGTPLYHIKFLLLSRGMKPVILQKEAENPFQAIAQLSDRMLEVLHRSLERRREKSRSERRKWKGSPHMPYEWRSAS